MISGDGWGQLFPTFVLQFRKNTDPGILTQPGIEPGTARWAPDHGGDPNITKIPKFTLNLGWTWIHGSSASWILNNLQQCTWIKISCTNVPFQSRARKLQINLLNMLTTHCNVIKRKESIQSIFSPKPMNDIFFKLASSTLRFRQAIFLRKAFELLFYYKRFKFNVFRYRYMMNFGEVPRTQLAKIHSPHLLVGAPGIFSDLLRFVQMLKREWGAESNEKLPHVFIPSKTAT